MLIYFYRVGRRCSKMGIPVAPLIMDGLIRFFYRCAISSLTDIGRGTVFAYGGIGVVIHRRAKIGDNCMIGSCVVVGGRSGHYDVPVIGDNCYVGHGAAVLGPIVLGNNVTVGANAVVITDVPDGCAVAGVPAKIVRQN